ncbi:ATP-binding cassette domain-containing protein [Leekyejoonella antrihumi]|uniref:ATP-binding cassette domain-containing protein n=1 Tax=Leekyejoonella antrihumi TaxID=1660198 RepID=A0A563DZL0_9MICO|nr:ATP-binding cassette domain-containing protein [Leekyejoonella antrihumi]
MRGGRTPRPGPGADSPDGPATLQVRDASLGYGDRRLWSDLTFDVQPGEFLAVLGANGSGKTSLLRAVLGLQPLTSGRVIVAGHPARRGDREIGYVPQQRGMDRATTTSGQRCCATGLGRASPRHRAPLLGAMGSGQRGVGCGRRRRIRECPGRAAVRGEQQRVRIAQALVADPSLLSGSACCSCLCIRAARQTSSDSSSARSWR